MSWRDQLQGDSLSWLLEKESPGARYLALRDLMDESPGPRKLLAAKKAAHADGPITGILAEMEDPGYWTEPGPGYHPKYRSTVWSIILLAQLGASAAEDERIARACLYICDHGLTPQGHFTASGAPSGTADCLQGNLCAALLDLGWDDPRLDTAFEWMARSVTGEGIAPMSDKRAPIRYYAGKCGPVFACGSNNKLPCSWGAVKVMLAFAKLPFDRRTPLIEQAIERGLDFIFSVDPASAEYPTGWTDKPSRNWWKFGFPVFYVTDLLQNVEALVLLGYGDDPRLANALNVIREKQDEQGRWALEYDYAGKTWVDFGVKRQPNKWVTLRALRVLKQVG
ncbi:MAG: nitrogen fixation protein NifH [Anaerolineales bacterium]|nr:nitrogen fixation protein NifH [Anaerolineales bacterium]